MVGVLRLQLGVAAIGTQNFMNDSHSASLAELETQLLRDPFNHVTRLAYARSLLAAGREPDALTQYDLARKGGAIPVLEEFERLLNEVLAVGARP